MTDTTLKMDQFKRPDPVLTSKIVTQLKSQGIFDEFRRECMADVDTKPAYQNLRQRVEGSVAAFLKMNPWRPDMNKNQLRDNLRKHIQSGGFLDIGVDRIVDQVVNPKIYTVFLPKVEEVVQSCLGMNKDKPKPEPSTPSNISLEPAKFQNKHNLAPRAALTGPRMPSLPNTDTLKPMESSAETNEEKSSAEEGNSPTTEKPTNDSFVMDEEEVEDADDDEESPPFEPHSQSDRLILGVRTDSSDSNSSDNQVVTTIVDDNLEERIDNDDEENNGSELAVKEDKDVDKDDLKKGDGFTSDDDSVPKTPTINMESSDGTMIEFNSISEYKRYQNKFGEDSIDNVEEEIVFSQWGDESNFVAKEEKNSNHEEHFEVLSQKRKLNFEHFDEKSSSSFDKSSSCDEGKSDSLSSSTPKKVKLEDDNETISEFTLNDDSNTDRSLDVLDIKHKLSSNKDKSKRSSSSSKEGRIHSHYHSHKEQKDSSSHHRSSSKGNHAHRESSSGHSSRDKHDKKDPSKEKSKDSLHKHHSKESKSKHSDKDKESYSDKKKLDKSEMDKKDKNESDKDRKESRHKHEHKSRVHHDKEKKKHDNHDKNSDVKKEYDSSHKQSSDRNDSSKHSHSSSKHGHRSYSDKHRSDKDHKHKHSSEKHKSQEKNSEKNSKHDLKKKQRDYCKSSSKDFEGRRSSDRDSNGPSGTNNFSSTCTFKSVTSKRNVESSAYSSDKITSNSDNSVSENIEPMQSSKFDSVSESGIASPDPETTADSWNEFESEFDRSKAIFGKDVLEIDKNSINQNSGQNTKFIDETEDHNFDYESDSCNILSSSSKQPELIEIDENSECNDYANHLQDISTPVLDTSSEKENIDIADCHKESENTAPQVCNTSDDKVVKFKKPKIAANIFEARKIMQERRHLKRMEKKRMKLLMKTNTAEYSTPESPPEMKVEEQDVFLGFDDVVSEKKLEKYDCLISRLNSEISMINKVEVNPNLITSLIEVNPNLDEYIETVLKGKVHRNTRVRLPPINDYFYKYDSEQNAYILIKNACEFVDSNLNNLNPNIKSQELHINNISNNCIRQDVNTLGSCEETFLKTRHDVSEESTSPKSDSENQHFILQANSDSDDSKSPTCMLNNNTFDDRDKELVDVIDLEDQNLAKVSDDILSIGIPSSSLNAITPIPKLAFSLTFNQTYDDILKEKDQDAEHENKQLENKCQRRGSTVVKITNSKTTEQVILKKVESGFVNNSQVPKITRSEPVINGKLTNSTSQLKQPPLIRRINKSNNVVLAPSSTIKSQCLNGVASPDSTNFEAEVALPDKISPKSINDMIGIGGNIIGQKSSTADTWLRQRDNKEEKQDGARQHQRYDSSDLYKPRIQLASRRVRGGQSSPDLETPSPTIITRKRSAVPPEVAASIPKRRR